MVTYTQLRDGSWGVRSDTAVSAGQSVTVKKKTGETKQESIKAVVWTDNKVWLCSIAGNKARSSGCSCDQSCCRPRCRCESYCKCRGGNVYDC